MYNSTIEIAASMWDARMHAQQNWAFQVSHVAQLSLRLLSYYAYS